MKKYILLILLSSLICQANAQIFYNKGAPITITAGGIVQINGNAENAATGVIDNKGSTTITGDFTNNATAGGDGTYYVAGNWINNSAFSSGTGSVILNGGAQNISGTASTLFNNLTLSGSGIKTQTIDQFVQGTLALNDRELATGSNTMRVNNVFPNTITRTTGFVSSTTGGSLTRLTQTNNTYLFPVGSSLGTLRYRPVEIAIENGSSAIFSVRMANSDANSEGYDRSLVDSSVCSTNPLYFHHISNSGSVALFNMAIYFDAATDGNWEGIANWNPTTSVWNNTSTATVNSGSPLSSVSISHWNYTGSSPYILTRKRADATIFPIDSICLNHAALDLSASETGGTWSGTGIIDENIGIFSPAVSGAGEFDVTYTIPGTCGDSDTKKITVENCSENNIYIPNIFSPNGDNQNDVLYVRGTYKTLHFTIYDRWGEKIFDSEDATTGWDGKFNNKPMNPGVFVYYADIELTNGTKITKKGNVTLAR